MSNIDNLKGRTILVGKEPENGRLFVSVKINGQPKSAAIGEMNSVPNTVSRCRPTENTAHCKVEVDAAGNIIITNLKPQNVTYINGAEIVSKKVKQDCIIELGKSRFSVSVNTIVEAAAKIVGAVVPPPPQVCSIKHLEKVWEKYHGRQLQMAKEMQDQAAKQSLTPILTVGSGVVVSTLTFVTPFAIVLGIPISAYGVFLMYKNYKVRKEDTTIDEKERLTEEFERDYVCPKCNHFLGYRSYYLVSQDKKCMFCNAVFLDK